MRSYIKVTGRAKQVKSNAESGPGMVVEEAYVHFEDTDARPRWRQCSRRA